MATINLKDSKAKFYASKPSTFINIDDGEGNCHEWEVINGGSLLQFEMARLGQRLQQLDPEGLATKDQEVAKRVMQSYGGIIDRFRGAFLATFKCKDDPEAPAKFYDANSSDLEYLATIIGQILQQATKKESD